MNLLGTTCTVLWYKSSAITAIRNVHSGVAVLSAKHGRWKKHSCKHHYPGCCNTFFSQKNCCLRIQIAFYATVIMGYRLRELHFEHFRIETNKHENFCLNVKPRYIFTVFLPSLSSQSTGLINFNFQICRNHFKWYLGRLEVQPKNGILQPCCFKTKELISSILLSMCLEY